MKIIPSYMLGACKVLPQEYAIEFENGEKHSLQPKYIEMLNYLAVHYPRIITREELIDNIWQGNYYVGDKALTNTIWHLRQQLKQANEHGEYIETIRKMGYRLIVEPQWQEDLYKAGHNDNLPPSTSSPSEVNNTNSSFGDLFVHLF